MIVTCTESEVRVWNYENKELIGTIRKTKCYDITKWDNELFLACDGMDVECHSVTLVEEVIQMYTFSSKIVRLKKINHSLFLAGCMDGNFMVVSFSSGSILRVVKNRNYEKDCSLTKRTCLIISKLFDECFFANILINKQVGGTMKQKQSSARLYSSRIGETITDHTDFVLKEFRIHNTSSDEEDDGHIKKTLVTSMTSFVRQRAEYLICGTNEGTILIYNVEFTNLMDSIHVLYTPTSLVCFENKYLLIGDHVGGIEFYYSKGNPLQSEYENFTHIFGSCPHDRRVNSLQVSNIKEKSLSIISSGDDWVTVKTDVKFKEGFKIRIFREDRFDRDTLERIEDLSDVFFIQNVVYMNTSYLLEVKFLLIDYRREIILFKSMCI